MELHKIFRAGFAAAVLKGEDQPPVVAVGVNFHAAHRGKALPHAGELVGLARCGAIADRDQLYAVPRAELAEGAQRPFLGARA